MPFFSVIIPLYNKQDSIVRTLQSALAQTFGDFEIILVNDGSTDDSLSKAKTVVDARIHLFDTKNQGVSQARNFGGSQAKGKLMAFLDADDLWFPAHLETLKRLYEQHPDCGLYATSYERYFGPGKIVIPHFVRIPDGFEGIVPDFFGSGLVYRLAWTSAVAVPKATFEEVGKFDPEITLGAGEDTDLWVRLALAYPVAFSNTVTASHRLDAEHRLSHSQTLKRKFADFKKFEAVEKTNLTLKKFLDRYRAEYALKHKLAGDSENFRFYRNGIDDTNISIKTKWLLGLPSFVLRLFYRIKKIGEKANFPTSAY